MKNFIVGLFVGVLLLLAVVWFYSDKNTHAEKAKEEIKSAATDTKDFVKDKMYDANLSPDDIKDELARTVKDFARDANTRSERFYRIINEVPAVLMVLIVILVVVQPFGG